VTDAPNFAVALSVDPDPVAAAAAVSREVRAQLGAERPTVAVMFASPHLCADPWALLDAVHEHLGPERLIGCTTEAVIGEGREVEEGPGLSIWCARLPDVSAATFRLTADATDDGYDIAGWPDPASPDDGTPLIVLADPFTVPPDALIARHAERGLAPIVGGMASGGARPGDHVMFLDRDVHWDGGVGLELPGAAVIPVVSQGCAPIGPDMVITAGGGPVIAELAGATAFDKITRVVDDLDADERRLLHQPLLAGIVINENQPDYDRGDFLIRGIHGRDPDTGAIYIGEQVRIGQTFRLHVRDADSADEDLRLALRAARDRPGSRPAAGLVFSCNGRGTRMFSSPDHDATAISEELGIPAAGMFCNGEIGPVGGRTFLHGFTATMAVFLTPSD
jgi:small ligand-binding sensory domain FIST